MKVINTNYALQWNIRIYHWGYNSTTPFWAQTLSCRTDLNTQYKDCSHQWKQKYKQKVHIKFMKTLMFLHIDTRTQEMKNEFTDIHTDNGASRLTTEK